MKLGRPPSTVDSSKIATKLNVHPIAAAEPACPRQTVLMSLDTNCIVS